MQKDIPEGGIHIVPMGVPTTGTQIHLHVPAPRRLFTKLKDGAAEVGTSFQILKTRVKHSNIFPVQGVQMVAQQALLAPNGLQQAFGGCSASSCNLGIAPERTRASAYQLSANEYTLTVMEIENEEIHKQNCLVYSDTCLPELS